VGLHRRTRRLGLRVRFVGEFGEFLVGLVVIEREQFVRIIVERVVEQRLGLVERFLRGIERREQRGQQRCVERRIGQFRCGQQRRVQRWRRQFGRIGRLLRRRWQQRLGRIGRVGFRRERRLRLGRFGWIRLGRVRRLRQRRVWW
jgi:hypothetical protein